MIEAVKNALSGQYGAALSMLEKCLDQCPDDRWRENVGRHAFWHVTYHALFYTDLYLSRDEKAYEPPSCYREDLQFFGRRPWPPYEEVDPGEPLAKAVLLEYVRLCRDKASASVAAETAETLEGPCGFWWYRIPRLEFHVNNIRHIQHHAAQLSLALRTSADVGVDWAQTG